MLIVDILYISDRCRNFDSVSLYFLCVFVSEQSLKPRITES